MRILTLSILAFFISCNDFSVEKIKSFEILIGQVKLLVTAPQFFYENQFRIDRPAGDSKFIKKIENL
jgi:hypothetical protein